MTQTQNKPATTILTVRMASAEYRRLKQLAKERAETTAGFARGIIYAELERRAGGQR